MKRAERCNLERSIPARRRATWWVAAILCACAYGFPALVPAQAPPPIPTESVKPLAISLPLAIVLDASTSMCGFLEAKGGQRALIRLMQKAVEMERAGEPVRVYLLVSGKEATGSREPSVFLAKPRTDLVPAPTELFSVLAQATSCQTTNDQGYCTQLPKDFQHRSRSCNVFPGSTSPLEVVFQPQKALNGRVDSFVLISDGQVREDARRRFGVLLGNWLQLQGNGYLNAGMVVSQDKFSGAFFPESSRAGAAQTSGYALKEHDRPLTLLWTTKSRRHTEIVKLLSDLMPSPRLVRQVAPYESEAIDVVEHEPIRGPKLGVVLSQTLGVVSEPVTLDAPGQKSARSRSVCDFKARIDEPESTVKKLVFLVPQKCSDDRQPFEGRAQHLIRWGISESGSEASKRFSVRLTPGKDALPAMGMGNVLSFQILERQVRDKDGKASAPGSFFVNLEPATLPESRSLSTVLEPYSLADDSCDNFSQKAETEAACRQKLDRKSVV